MQDKEEVNKKIDFVRWFSELDKNSGKFAGGKGANLGEVSKTDVPVPPGFVVTAQAYDYFIEKAGIKDKIKETLNEIEYEDTKQLNKATTKIRELIVNSKMPEGMKEEIIESYENLDTSKIERGKGTAHDILRHSNEEIFVAVRSSATTEDLAEASFAGQQDSFLNVKGNSDLIKHIKKCFASLFTSRATYYRNKKGFKHEDASLAVVIQKMVDSDKSGVIFSKDPSHKNDNIIMEAVWGLGEGIVSGMITPDKYVISNELEIKDKMIADKKVAITRNSGGDKEIVKLKPERSKQQVLTEFEIKKLSEFALKLEEHYGKPQDVEFAIEGEEIYIVQTRPITTIETRSDEIKEIKGDPILKGLAASPGIASGKIKIIENLDDLDKIQKGDILVTKMTNPDMVVTMQKSAAIITDEGGLTAHAAIVSREMGIPCIVGTGEATTKLKDNEIITVNGFSGKIYKGKVAETKQKEVLPVTAKTKTKIKVIVDLPSFAERASKTNLNKVGLTRIEGIIAESGKHPNYFLKKKDIEGYEEIIYNGIKTISDFFDEMWVRTSDIRSDEYENLEGAPKEKEANPMLGMHGIRFGIKYPEILKAELRALKKVANNNKKIGLLLPQVINVSEVQEVKKYLKEVDFTEAKVGVMIETPAAVQGITSLCEEGIDFISFGTNDLTQYMLAIDRGNEKVQHLYDEMHPSILYQLGYVIRVCKRNNVETSICGQSGSKKPMVKYLVEKGIDSISVNADVAKDISDYVAELENEMVAGTDKEPRKYQPTKSIEEKKEIETPKPDDYGEKEQENKKSKEEFVKTEENFKQENVLDEVKENVEEGIEKIEEVAEKTFGDKRGEAPLGVYNVPDKEKYEQENREEISSERNEEFDHEPEFIENSEEEVSEEKSSSERRDEEDEEFDHEPEFIENSEEKENREEISSEENKRKENEVLDIF